MGKSGPQAYAARTGTLITPRRDRHTSESRSRNHHLGAPHEADDASLARAQAGRHARHEGGAPRGITRHAIEHLESSRKGKARGSLGIHAAGVLDDDVPRAAAHIHQARLELGGERFTPDDRRERGRAPGIRVALVSEPEPDDARHLFHRVLAQAREEARYLARLG